MKTQLVHTLLLAAVVASFVLLGSPGQALGAVDITLEPPGDREFVRDLAGIITPADEQQIREMCDKLLTEKATPIIVVSIESMADHGGAGMRIETFSTLLFNQWGIGYEKLNDQLWNTGILFLISTEDRKARIELGAGWGREKNAQCEQIMQDYVIPRFKQGDYSGGIVGGVQALDRMARELELPAIKRPWWHYAVIAGFIGLAIFTAVSLARRGSSGWAWLLWGALFAVVGYTLYSLATSSSRGGGGGGFSGGSFGGGSSGGGGATGSW